MGLGLVTVLNSLLLLIGSKWGHQACLFLWIYITVFTTLISNINNTLRNSNFAQNFLIVPSLTLEGYFTLVVASLICKFNEKRDESNSYTEMHSSDGKELSSMENTEQI
ncbi:GM20139 [Drosophila sechellia]|uniref:GM20139 n=2 Tax=Drosophila sechellia TaxID=7238 RepID=B4HS40_DROSE|nr:GM20139 [Drosophila sechellia]